MTQIEYTKSINDAVASNQQLQLRLSNGKWINIDNIDPTASGMKSRAYRIATKKE